MAPVIRLVTMLAFPDHERLQYLFTACRIDTIAFGCLDTRFGAPALTAAPCGGARAGHEVVYQLEVSTTTRISATVVDRGGVDVDVHIVAGSACLGSGGGSASGNISPGTAFVIVDAATAAVDGEFLVVIEAE